MLVLNPSLLIHQVHLGTVPSWTQLIFALSLAMLAYTGIETVSNMAEEAKDPGKMVPKAVNLVVIAVLGVYAGISVDRAVGAAGGPVSYTARSHSRDRARHVYQNDPVLGIVDDLGLHGDRRCTSPSTTSACWRRRSCSSPPTPG